MAGSKTEAAMSFYPDKCPRSDRSGNHYYSVTYVDGEGKRRRLPKSVCFQLKTFSEAKAFAKSESAKAATRKDYVQKKLEWRRQYLDFPAQLDKYQKWQEQRAPNSFESNVHYLEHWIFPFFLTQKGLNNPNDWHMYLREFVDWLQASGIHEVGKKKKSLAASTVNNIAKTLNTFFRFLIEYGKIDPQNVRKCYTIPEHKLNHRGLDDVISEREMKSVYDRLIDISKPTAEFFIVLWSTGMRFSELFGLPITSLFPAPVQNSDLHEEFQKAGLSYHGYLVLDSQPQHDDRRREQDKSIKRKPLKSCKVISDKHARTIPIVDKQIWNILASRYKLEVRRWENREYTKDKQDYVFFDDLEWNRAVNSLRRAYKELGINPKPFHCCRHSYTTLLVGKTRNFFLVRAITGHKKDKSFERYLHIYEKMARENRQNEQTIELIS
jgi:integrase